MNPDNAWGLCITAAAGTELATSYSSGTVRNSSLTKAVYDPKAFIPHAASLDQAFAHCPIFPTAASRRSRGRVAVPVWRYTLSGPLTVLGLVSFYLANYLMVRRPCLKRPPKADFTLASTSGIKHPFGWLFRTWKKFPRVTQPFATVAPRYARLLKLKL